MKVGDKVYCIKNRFSYIDIVNMAEKEYTIMKIEYHDRIYLNNEQSSDLYYYLLYDDGTHYYYKEHFITLQEYRKNKLNKINESRR